MTNTKTIRKQIPKFKSYQEEAKFWQTHSAADYLHEMKPVKVRFAKNLSQGITIRFDKRTLENLRETAHKKGMGPTTLARMWILEHLHELA